ncbi:hypothetical protein [Massilia aquatica]|uniref:Uncharacterized protein n=1 Tax=Massilia aquatica TaxID=2609000 RepID=A0ABX0LYN3_9BURK|nr:hypothetical protein [Massilia aquatica]NHZ39973.1 hypothetical protein [Massilia aquatica]
MLLNVVKQVLRKNWMLPFAVALPFALASYFRTGAVDWPYTLFLLAAPFAGLLLIKVPIEYHAARKRLSAAR